MNAYEPLDLDRDMPRIFTLPNGRVAKFVDDGMRGYEIGLERLGNEATIQSRLFSLKYPVPRSYGIETVKLPPNLREIFERKSIVAHIMEYVRATPLDEITDAVIAAKATSEYVSSLERIRRDLNLGITPTDCGPHQVLVRPDRKMIFCDFEEWIISK